MPVLFCLLLCLTAGALHAEEPGTPTPDAEVQATPTPPATDDAAPEGRLSEEVVVTANRVAQDKEDVAANVTVFNEAEVEATAGLTTDHVLRRIPGFSLTRQQSSLVAAGGTQESNVRNLGSGSARTLVLLDGAPFNDPYEGLTYWARVPPASIERIEVIRGAGSNVWGNRAMAGVISVFTRRPTERALDVTAYAGERNTASLNVFGAELFGPVALSVSANGFDTDGYPVFREDVRGAVDEAAFKEYQTYNFKLEAPLSDRANAFLRGNYFDEDQNLGTDIRESETDIGEIVAGADLITRGLDEWSFHAMANDRTTLTWDSSISRDRNSESLAEFVELPSSSFAASAVWSKSAGARHRLMSGIDWTWVDTEFRQQTEYVGGEFEREEVIPGKQQLGGVFLQDLLELTPKWRLTAAGRLDYIRNYGGATRITDDGVSVVDIEYDTFSSTTFNPSLGVVYHPTAVVSWRASAYRGFRAPTADELYQGSAPRGAVVAPNPDLKPEHLVGVETGVNLARGPVSGQVTLWSNVIEDRVTILDVQAQGPIGGIIEPCGFVQPDAICRVRANIGEMTANGAELDLDYRLRSPWSFSVSYLYDDAEFSDAPDNPEIEGLVPRHVPEHSYTARVVYSSPRLFSGSLQGRYVGERFEDDANQFAVGSVFVVDVTASKDLTEKVAVFANVENLLDEPYEVRVTSTLVEIGSPRWVYGGVRLRF